MRRRDDDGVGARELERRGRLLVLAGPGVIDAAALPALRAFAAAGDLGVANTWGAKGVFAWDSPHHLGTCGLQARDFELLGVGDADAVVTVGLDPDESPIERLGPVPTLQLDPGDLVAATGHVGAHRCAPAQRAVPAPRRRGAARLRRRQGAAAPGPRRRRRRRRRPVRRAGDGGAGARRLVGGTRVPHAGPRRGRAAPGGRVGATRPGGRRAPRRGGGDHGSTRGGRRGRAARRGHRGGGRGTRARPTGRSSSRCGPTRRRSPTRERIARGSRPRSPGVHHASSRYRCASRTPTRWWRPPGRWSPGRTNRVGGGRHRCRSNAARS